jgi:hypothetical protein
VTYRSERLDASVEFKQDPLGKFVDPDKVAADRAGGAGPEQIHAKAMGGGYAPEASGRAATGAPRMPAFAFRARITGTPRESLADGVLAAHQYGKEGEAS